MPGNPQIVARLYSGLNSCGGVYEAWENHCVKGGGREKAAFSGDFGGLPRQHFALWRTALCFDSGIMVHRYWVVADQFAEFRFPGVFYRSIYRLFWLPPLPPTTAVTPRESLGIRDHHTRGPLWRPSAHRPCLPRHRLLRKCGLALCGLALVLTAAPTFSACVHSPAAARTLRCGRPPRVSASAFLTLMGVIAAAR